MMMLVLKDSRWNECVVLGTLILVGLTSLMLTCFADTIGSDKSVSSYRRVEIPGIQNAFRVADKIVSGSQPETDEAYAALAKMGVKTLISVDGSKPDVASAHRFGLHYIHLPFGYDGVPPQRIAELAAAVKAQTGPVFIHCHHGLHRGPAAVAVVCEANAGWTPEQAQSWMRTAGTSPDYAGLYRSVAQFKSPTAKELRSVGPFREVLETSKLIDAMVQIDDRFVRLKQDQKAGWKKSRNQELPISSRAQEATELWELFRELARLEEVRQRPESFRTHLSEAETAVAEIRTSIQGEASVVALDKQLAQLTSRCTACHKEYRNP